MGVKISDIIFKKWEEGIIETEASISEKCYQ